MIDPAFVPVGLALVVYVACFIKSINHECSEKTYHEQQIYTHNKYSIWQCHKRGHVPYYELRRKLRWWGEDVVTFDTDIAVVVNKLKQLEEFPSKVDWVVVQYIKKELEKK